jgi:hypothetical protein
LINRIANGLNMAFHAFTKMLCSQHVMVTTSLIA